MIKATNLDALKTGNGRKGRLKGKKCSYANDCHWLQLMGNDTE